LVWLGKVHRDEVGTAFVPLRTGAMVRTARVELDAAFADSTGLDLDPDEATVGRNDGTKVERQPSAERHENVNPARDESTKNGRFGRIPSLNRVHACTVIQPSDRTHVRVP
jgi:hypothetical protein